MGREVRMVPKDWEHPTDDRGEHIQLLDGYEKDLEVFAKDIEEKGLGEALDWHGGGPVPDHYMLVGVPQSERTHYMMYQNVGEGSPISPAFETPEELARWLADNQASAMGHMTANYEQWLATIRAGSAPSGVFANGKMHSGVEYLGEVDHERD